MVTASASGRSRVGSRTVRSSKHKRSSSKRGRDGSAAGSEAKLPNAGELRRLRDVYFGRPVRERRTVITPVSKPVARASSAKERDGPTVARTSRRSSSSRTGGHYTRRSTQKAPDRVAEYVYSLTAERPVDRDGTADDRSKATSVRSSRSRHSTSSRRRHREPDVDDEVTPDDSISQVGGRRTRSSRSAATKRHTLPIIAESKDDSARTSVSRRQSRRDSTFLGSIFRRNSTSTVLTPKHVECLTCGADDVPSGKAAKLACGHNMCHSCLKRVFRLSVQDPAHMPPKCCTDQHIPLQHVVKLFDIRFKLLFNKKFDEYNTKDRTYCPNVKCGTWIRPSHYHTSSGRKYALCPKCKTKACILCGLKQHKSRDCPKDPEIAKLVEQAEREGWKRCYSCSAMVELKEGCNHMTCRCTAEFCMVCGSKWKTCDCPWFNYTQLPGDRLDDMRVPDPFEEFFRHVLPRPEPPAPAPPPPPAAPFQARTYRGEVEQRRVQERTDAALARRMQLASISDDDEAPPRRRETETWGIGNAARHLMNDDFVRNDSNVVMDAFGDALVGRREGRTSGRRRAARTGLPSNFFEDANVLGIGSARR